MRKTVFCLALLGLFVICASAADFTGKWTAQVPGRGGNTMETTFNLKADGSKLTGNVANQRGETPISNGSISGDTASFTTVLNFNGNEIKINYKCSATGSDMKCTREREGGNQSQEFTAKKATT